MWKTKFSSHKQYLFGLFVSRKSKKAHKDQRPKYTTNFFTLSEKKPLSVYIIDTTCYDECFLFHVITRRHYFYTNLSLQILSYNRHAAAFLETNVLKEVRILYPLSPQ